MSDGDSPQAAAAIARLKSTLDTQAVISLVGMVAVSAFLVFTSEDEGGLQASVFELAPWVLGLSALMLAANRWTLSLRAKAIRRAVDPQGASLKGR